MLERNLRSQFESLLDTIPLVCLGGPRGVGKRTFVSQILSQVPHRIIDLESPASLHQFDDLETLIDDQPKKLLILREIHRFQELIPRLCQLLKERSKVAQRAPILLMSPIQPRKSYGHLDLFGIQLHELELTPLLLIELGFTPEIQSLHWLRGGFPKSYQASSHASSIEWRNQLIRDILERDLPLRGITASPIQMRRMCMMLAQQQGGTLNLRQMGASLGLDGKTVAQYLKHLENHYLIRSLPAWQRETGKKMVKTPKTFWRDSGLLHALLNIGDEEQLLSHPLCSQSWKGYCIEQILCLLPLGFKAMHYRTHAGAEVDLVLEGPTGAVHAISICRHLHPKLTPAFKESMQTLKADSGSYLTPEGETHLLAENVQATSLRDFLQNMPQ